MFELGVTVGFWAGVLTLAFAEGAFIWSIFFRKVKW